MIPLRSSDNSDKLAKLIGDLFREQVGRRWVLVNGERLELHHQKLAKLSAVAGVSDSANSRLLNEGASSFGVLALLAFHVGRPLCNLEASEIIAAGIAGVLSRVAWCRELNGRRPNRVDIPAAPAPCDAILLAALWGSDLLRRWHVLTVQYGSDITQAFSDKTFQRFVRELGQEYLRICPGLKDAERFAAEHFVTPNSSENSLWSLCERIDRNWRAYHVALQETFNAVSHLLPSRGPERS